MKRFTLIGLALMAVLAMAAIPVSAASAATPEILPSSTEERAWTGSQEGEKSTLTGPLNVECTAAEGLGTLLSGKPLGLFHIHFSGCKSATKLCTGLDELTAGVILVLGTWHLWWDREVGTEFKLTVATVYLVLPFHFSCGGALLAEAKGEVVCLDLKAEEKNKTHSFHCIPKLNSKSEPEPKQNEEYCEVDPCTTWLVPLLLTATNMGTFKESSELALGNWKLENGQELFTEKL